jgi:cytochrome c1
VPTGRNATLLPGMLVLLAHGGCKAPPHDRHEMPAASAARGLAAIKSSGCGACHSIPGVDWPRGRVGPALTDYAERTMIAGRLPNRPDILARWVRAAPSLIPGTAMPAIPISEEEARDVAAYLYTLGGR